MENKMSYKKVEKFIFAKNGVLDHIEETINKGRNDDAAATLHLLNNSIMSRSEEERKKLLSRCEEEMLKRPLVYERALEMQKWLQEGKPENDKEFEVINDEDKDGFKFALDVLEAIICYRISYCD